ncbi:MAG: hypothetical protein JWN52_6810 [Actinomycetia bacterium]|nr:hypothetical protein [Actinomycetes bacterium]
MPVRDAQGRPLGFADQSGGTCSSPGLQVPPVKSRSSLPVASSYGRLPPRLACAKNRRGGTVLNWAPYRVPNWAGDRVGNRARRLLRKFRRGGRRRGGGDESSRWFRRGPGQLLADDETLGVQDRRPQRSVRPNPGRSKASMPSSRSDLAMTFSMVWPAISWGAGLVRRTGSYARARVGASRNGKPGGPAWTGVWPALCSLYSMSTY